jgi:putative PIN family toxin of toxin-antitoxin system
VLRAVLDVGVIVSGVLAAGGPPGQILNRWRGGELDLVVSPSLLAELQRVLAYDRIRSRISPEEAQELAAELRHHAIVVDDPREIEPGLTRDPGDDYLVALARSAGADVLVSGDPHITGVAGLEPPVLTPRQLLELLQNA